MKGKKLVAGLLSSVMLVSSVSVMNANAYTEFYHTTNRYFNTSSNSYVLNEPYGSFGKYQSYTWNTYTSGVAKAEADYKVAQMNVGKKVGSPYYMYSSRYYEYTDKGTWNGGDRKFYCGDVNCDGEITLADCEELVFALEYVYDTGIAYPSTDFYRCTDGKLACQCDVNGDNVINQRDIDAIEVFARTNKHSVKTYNVGYGIDTELKGWKIERVGDPGHTWDTFISTRVQKINKSRSTIGYPSL